MDNRDVRTAFSEWLCSIVSRPIVKAGVHAGIRNEYERDYIFVNNLYNGFCFTEEISIKVIDGAKTWYVQNYKELLEISVLTDNQKKEVFESIKDNAETLKQRWIQAFEDRGIRVLRHHLEASRQQAKKIQSVIDTLMTMEDADMYIIINRLRSFHLEYLERKNIYVSDLYDYILKTANECINTAKQDFVKKECGIVIQIITQLKDGVSTDDIVRTILPPKANVCNDVKEEVVTTDSIDDINESANERSDDQQDKGEVVEDLNNHPLRDKEYYQQLRKKADVLHQNGELDKEIDFIRETIRSYESAGLPSKNWQLLLKVRIAEIAKKENVETIVFVMMFDFADDYKNHKDYGLLKRQLETLAENYPAVARYVNNILSQAVLSVNREGLKNALSTYDKSRGQLCRWVAPDEVVEVQGVKLTRGNFYIGECFLLPDNIIKDNSLYGSLHKGHYFFGAVLNPDLSAVSGDSYKAAFCSYKDMSPAWRYEYLTWLSGEKNAAEVSVEILMFYLYGCEIKMFIDPTTGFTERKAILTSIVELRKSLNSNPSDKNAMLLQRKINDFIGCACVKYFSDDKTEIEHSGILKQSDTFQDILIANILKGEKILRAETAYELAVIIFDFENIVPEKYRSAAKQRFVGYFNKEFKEVSLHYSNMSSNDERYTNHYISYNHRDCAFQSENVLLTYTTEAVNSYTYSVKDAVRNCCWNVEGAFKKYNEIVASSNGEETVEAILALPEEVDIHNIPKILTLIKEIDSIVDNTRYGETTVNHILQLLECRNENDQTLYKETIDSIISGLSRLGYGIAPNYETDRKRLNFGDICVIYRNKEHHPIKSTTKYDRSELFIKLALYIVQEDNATVNDFAFVEQQLKSYENIPGNHLHLTAVVRWRFLYKKQSIDKRAQNIIALLTSAQRTSMGKALIRLACINGDIHPKRIDSLKKVLPLLGIESENIHSQVRRLLTAGDSFAVVEKKSDAVEFTINGEPAYTQKPAAPSVTINPKKLRIFEQQTKAAQELLSGIFVEEDATIPQKTETDNAVSVWMEILKTLLAKEVWQRAEIDSMCKERGLMPGAVLEQINDYAYEKVDDAVIEDDGDNIYVTLDYKDELI